MAIVHPGGTTGALNVACRNVSCGGMSVLHDSYIHTGSRCVATLSHPRYGPTGVHGTVARCLHLRGTIHEVGIAFDAPLAARDFAGVDLLGDWFSLERVDPGLLAGRVLCATTSRADSALVAHSFRASRLAIVNASTLGDALNAARKGCDLVIADFDLGASGAGLIPELRAGGLWTPVVLLVPDIMAASRPCVRASGAGGILIRPLAPDMLLRAAGEFLLLPGASDPLLCTLPPAHPDRAFLPGYIDQLRGLADRLEAAVGAGQAGECRSICLAVQGSASALGLERLSHTAASAAEALASAGPLEAAAGALKVLITTCRPVFAGDTHGRVGGEPSAPRR